MTRTLSAVAAALSLLCLGRCAVAAPPAANPWLAGYADYAALEKQIDALAKSPLVKVESLATTLGGRKVFLLTLGTGKTQEKPAILLVGNVQATHVVGSELALRIAQDLVEQGQAGVKPGDLLDRFTLYVIPRPNPDGTERNFHGAPLRESNGNERKTDDDRDFSQGEDPPDDLNGDGLITVMRVADDTGTWRTHPDDARVLIEADAKKNEQGQYKVYVEGKDDDSDGLYNEDPGDGVSFNRNFAFKYPVFELAAGPFSNSEAESRAIADFAFDHPNIGLVYTFTPDDSLMQPWKPPQGDQGRIKTQVLPADAPYYNFLAEKYQKLAAKDAPAPPPAAGSFSEWAYFQYGRWSLGTRAWWPPKIALDDEAKKKLSGEAKGEDDLNLLRWLTKENLDGFVEWTPVELSQFAGRKVEVGGFRPTVRWNPPAKELPELAKKQLDFLKQTAELLPRLEFSSLKADAVGGGVYRVTGTVVNRGYLPTMSEMGRITGEAYPLQITLELPPGAKLLQGAPRASLARLEGGATADRTWLVRLTGPAGQKGKVRAWAPAVGTVESEIEFK